MLARFNSVDRETEQRLVARVRDGDPAAFDAIYDAFNGRLFAFLARLCGNRTVAEDLLEDTWLRFVTAAARLTPETVLGPWLFTIARNVHVSYCRSRAIERSALEAFSLWPQPAIHTPYELAASDECAQRVEAAIAAMPIVLREVLMLAIDGMKPTDIAAVCGITPEACRQRLKRARARVEDACRTDTSTR